MKILNLTQHKSTPEQKQDGVIDLQGEDLQMLKDLLTFEEIPDIEDLVQSANFIAVLALDWIRRKGIKIDKVMIGGAPFFMSTLEEILSENFDIVYSFTERKSIEIINHDNNSVIKKSVFKHIGFVEL